MNQTNKKLLLRTRNELISLVNGLLNRIDEIDRIMHCDRAVNSINFINGSDGSSVENSCMEADLESCSSAIEGEREADDEAEMTSGPEFEETGSGETMTDDIFDDIGFDSEMSDINCDSESELNSSSINLSITSLSSLNDLSDF